MKSKVDIISRSEMESRIEAVSLFIKPELKDHLLSSLERAFESGQFDEERYSNDLADYLQSQHPEKDPVFFFLLVGAFLSFLEASKPPQHTR